MDIATQCNRVAALVALIDGMRTPTALGWARPDRIVVLEPMPGLPWTQLPQHDQPIAMQRFGSALAHVHELPTELSRGPFQRYRSERVRNSAALVGVARPDVDVAAHRLRDQLAAGPPTHTSEVYLHGDVHANNVLFHGDEVNMIDFDQGGFGAASADLGSMLASLMSVRLVSPDTAVEGLGAAFLDGYSAVRPLPSTAELGWYTAAACVAERAIRAVNRLNQPVLEVLPQLLEMAEATLAGKVDLDE
jgi:Ser/Thr protein kinase RdoA (MazF antagonist)